MNDTLRPLFLGIGLYLTGVATGATGMIYLYEKTKVVTKPVVTVEQEETGVSRGLPGGLETLGTPPAPPLALEQQIAQAKADIEARFAQVERDHEARLVRVEQRNKEFAFAERKLAGVKTWDLKLGEVGK